MKKNFLWISLISLILFTLTGCGTQPTDHNPNKNIDSASSDPSTAPFDESAALDAPDWAVWLANSWGGDADEWMNESKCAGIDIELWLREHPQYGETVKCWSLGTAISTLGIVKMESDSCSLSDEALRNDVSEFLAKQLMSELSTPDPQRTFEFVDYDNLSVLVNWDDNASIYVCSISADVSYSGIILPCGSCPQSSRLHLPLGAFELDCSNNIISLIPVYPDTLQRIND